jgi:hypothetical protein
MARDKVGEVESHDIEPCWIWKEKWRFFWMEDFKKGP